MLIEIVNKNAEEALLSLIEEVNRKNTAMVGIYFQLSKVGASPKEDDIINMFKSMLGDRQAKVYFFRDGDILIAWHGAQKALIEEVRKKLYEQYPVENLDSYYDLHAQGEELRMLIKKKIEAIPPSPKATNQPLLSNTGKQSTTLKIDSDQIAFFKAKAKERKGRMKTEVLVVEDQNFSKQLLVGMLDKNYKTYGTASAEQGMELYLAHAPDIVFLDIELPGMNGHQFAEQINKLDPDSYIVMVTANSYTDDVMRAKNNNAKGYVVKPYSKQKILDSLKNLKK